MNRACKNDPNRLCYICGTVTMPNNQSQITKFVKTMYRAYFGIKLGDQDKNFAPHMCCKTCIEILRSWSKGRAKSLPFGIPMIWREGKDHVTDCYFCMTNLQGPVGHTHDKRKPSPDSKGPHSLRKSSSDGLLRNLFRRGSLTKSDEKRESQSSKLLERTAGQGLSKSSTEDEQTNKAFRSGTGPLILVPQIPEVKPKKRVDNKGIQQISPEQASKIVKDREKLKEKLFNEPPVTAKEGTKKKGLKLKANLQHSKKSSTEDEKNTKGTPLSTALDKKESKDEPETITEKKERHILSSISNLRSKPPIIPKTAPTTDAKTVHPSGNKTQKQVESYLSKKENEKHDNQRKLQKIETKTQEHHKVEHKLKHLPKFKFSHEGKDKNQIKISSPAENISESKSSNQTTVSSVQHEKRVAERSKQSEQKESTAEIPLKQVGNTNTPLNKTSIYQTLPSNTVSSTISGTTTNSYGSKKYQDHYYKNPVPLKKYLNYSELPRPQKSIRENQEKKLLELHLKHLEEINKLRSENLALEGINRPRSQIYETSDLGLADEQTPRVNLLFRSNTFDTAVDSSTNNTVITKNKPDDLDSLNTKPLSDSSDSKEQDTNAYRKRGLESPTKFLNKNREEKQPFSFSSYLIRNRKDSVGEKDKVPSLPKPPSEDKTVKVDIPKKVRFPDETKNTEDNQEKRSRASITNDSQSSNLEILEVSLLPKVSTVSILKKASNCKEDNKNEDLTKTTSDGNLANSHLAKRNDLITDNKDCAPTISNNYPIPVRPPRSEKPTSRERSFSASDAMKHQMSEQRIFKEGPQKDINLNRKTSPSQINQVKSQPILNQQQQQEEQENLQQQQQHQKQEKQLQQQQKQQLQQQEQQKQLKEKQLEQQLQEEHLEQQKQLLIQQKQLQELQQQQEQKQLQLQKQQQQQQEQKQLQLQKQQQEQKQLQLQKQQQQQQQQPKQPSQKNSESLRKTASEEVNPPAPQDNSDRVVWKNNSEKKEEKSVREVTPPKPPQPPSRGNKSYGKVHGAPQRDSSVDDNKPEGILVTACKVAEEDQILRLLRDLSRTCGFESAFINQLDKGGRTALSHACSNGFGKVVEFLTSQQDVDLNLPDNESNTPLHYAAQGGHVEIVSHLVNTCSRHVDLDVRNNLGFTPLMKAALQGRTKIAKILLFAGASPHLRDFGRGFCALEWAKFTGRGMCGELIESVQRSCSSHIKERWTSDPDFKLSHSGSNSSLSHYQYDRPAGGNDNKDSWLKHKIKKAFHKSESKREFSVASNLSSLATCVSSPLLPCQPPSQESTVPKVQITEVSAPDCYFDPDEGEGGPLSPQSSEEFTSEDEFSANSNPSSPEASHPPSNISSNARNKPAESIPSIQVHCSNTKNGSGS